MELRICRKKKPRIHLLKSQIRDSLCGMLRLPRPDSCDILGGKGGKVMNSEIICAIISAAGVITSAIVSLFVSRLTASSEIRKTELEWKLRGNERFDLAVVEMSEAVMKFADSGYISSKRNALSKLAAARSLAPAGTRPAIDNLIALVRSEDMDAILPALANVHECHKSTQT